MRKIIFTVAVFFLGALAWKYHQGFTEFVKPSPPPKSIVFDNGSARKEEAAPQPARQQEVLALPNGTARKCIRGSETIYTNTICPDGYKERKVDTSRVTVVSGTGTVGASLKQEPANAKNALRDALDLNHDPNLRGKMIDRAMSDPK